MGLKLVAQPTTAGDFTKPTYPTSNGKRVLNRYDSKSVSGGDPTPLNFTVPSGMKFILHGMGSEATVGVGEDEALIWLGSLVIDGVTIYPMYPAAGGMNYYSIKDSDMWPFTQKVEDNIGFSAHDGIAIDTQLSVNARAMTISGTVKIYGLFVKA